MNNPILISNQHLTTDNGATGYSATGLQRTSTTAFLWKRTFLTMLLEEDSLLCTPDWYCHTLLASKHEAKPLLAFDDPARCT